MSVIYEVQQRRATLTIDDAEHRNPLSVETMGELVELTRQAMEDDEVGVIVYTGSGDRAFSAGGDLGGSFADDAIGLHRARGEFAELLRLMTGGPKPTVARVNGHALAGGFGLAVACDITVCVEDAKLGTPEVSVGLWPMMISAVLASHMPRKAALELMLTGRIIDPHEAQRLGAVSRVVPRESLDEVVDDLVGSILSASPATLMIGKGSWQAATGLDFDTALARLQGGLTEVMLTEDAEEGVAAFLEKRDPNWSGL